MEEFERIENNALYADSVEALPIIIRYRQNNVEWNNKQLASTGFEQLVEEYSGIHECYFINKGLDKKGKQLIQIMIVESDYNIKLCPGKEGRYFYNPLFEEEKFVLPIDENEYKSKVCNVIFSKDDEDIWDLWTRIGWLNRVQEVKEFIDSCSTLQRPLKEIRMEEDRQIWQAYIDGLNALNDSKKELFKIKSIGNIRKGKDYRGKPIKSITIELDSANQNDSLKDDIIDLFSSQFEVVPKVSITQKVIKIEYDSYRIISEDLLSDLEDKVRESCYVLVEDQPVYRLSGSIGLKVKRSDYEYTVKELDAALTSFGAEYTKIEDEYVFTNDEDENFFEKFVAKSDGNYINIERNTSLVGKFSFFDKSGLQDVLANIKSRNEVKEASFYESGFVIVEAMKELDLEDKAFSCLQFSSCRIKVTPQKFDPNIQVLAILETKNGAYYSTISDIRKVSKQPNGWKFSVVNAYQKAGIKTWVNVEYFYAFRIGVDKAMLRPLQLHFLDHEKINVNSVKGEIELLPINSLEYVKLQQEVAKVLPVGLIVDYPDYSISSKLLFLIDNEFMCKRAFNDIGNSLSSIRFDHYSFAKDDNTKVLFDLSFKTEEERDRYIRDINQAMQEHGSFAEVSFTSLQGSTTISFVLDEKLLEEKNKSLQRNFSNEQVNYVSAKYDEIRNKLENERNEYASIIEDYEEDDDAVREFESQVRYAQNMFKRKAPSIGTCLLRTPESVKIKVSDSFIEQIQNGEVKLLGGYLQFPVIGSSMELSRQKNAMDMITNPGAVFGSRHIGYPANRNLPNFLFDPRYADDIEADIDEEKAKIANTVIEKGLNDKQLEAVTKAILAKDMAFIQGPPGTGKTTVIAEIIWQEVLKNKDCRILLTSQTNLAVDNALERLQGKRGIRPVRIVPQSKIENLEREGRRYLLPLIEDWRDKCSKDDADNAVNLWIDTIHDSISSNVKYSDVLAQWKKDLETKDEDIRQIFVQSYKSKVNLAAATCSICGSRDFVATYQALYGEPDPHFDVVIMDEASKATPLEMAVPMVLGKKIIIIGDHKQLPPMMDENSIDTALKKIGRNELAKKLENIKESQFKRLFEAAQKVRTKLVATLDTQYRMHEQIMQSINHFYKDDLVNGLQCGIKETMNDPDFKNKGSRYHGLDFKNIFRPNIHAIWINVHSPEKKEGTSYTNPAELEAIKLVVEALQKSEGYSQYMDSQQKPEDKEIGLITFYSSQKRGIKDMQKKGKLGDNAFRIDVVDKFQGMERNIVIVSTVRSNKKNKMGFADRIERINVAFSRAKRLLIVVGDKQFFETNDYYRKSIAAMEVVDVKQLRDALR